MASCRRGTAGSELARDLASTCSIRVCHTAICLPSPSRPDISILASACTGIGIGARIGGKVLKRRPFGSLRQDLDLLLSRQQRALAFAGQLHSALEALQRF